MRERRNRIRPVDYSRNSSNTSDFTTDCSMAAACLSTSRDAPRHAMCNTNYEILHVDDDPQFTRLVTARLRCYGISTCSLNDPRECLDRIIHDGYRMLLLDLDMPHVDGLQLLREIKQHDGGIQVVVLTGLVTLSSAYESFRLGAEACLFKPVEDFCPLVEAIHRTFRKIDDWSATLHQLSESRAGKTLTSVDLLAWRNARSAETSSA
jgi:DNA-binding NtrC family response regulator